ncbi:hypothetical protein ACM41_24115 [Bradyrhizobium sp. CCBAU 21362]|uniref:hypothetical protein n=1 Tax=Bradyrhizobium sp. CCBAU 21362 TaxID=1325082 RepID=UPI0023063494|nr:hypothetical protein [Bradyrhizobium sp. CCBAU 21362]MDA9539191.1 hypothetical protein [Bradyrhizobium sp. CCBAU 21362]
MKKHYSIWVREIGSDHDVELMQCDSNPQALVDGLYAKHLTVTTDAARKKTKVGRYSWVRIVDNLAER